VLAGVRPQPADRGPDVVHLRGEPGLRARPGAHPGDREARPGEPRGELGGVVGAAVVEERAAPAGDQQRPRPVAVGEVQLAVLRPLVAVPVALDPYAVTPSERTASASRVIPSSICSGVTPE
jgi:hypothetical protein